LATAIENDTGTLVSSQAGQLTKVPTTATNPPATMAAADSAVSGLKSVRSLLDTQSDAAAAALVEALPAAIQRAESSGWRAPGTAEAAGSYAQQLTDEFDQIEHGVQVVGLSSGSYTLASSDSKLPITISNTLPYTVRVRVQIVPQTPGFSWKPTREQPTCGQQVALGVVCIEANSTRTVKISASTERSGLFRIAVVLNAPNRSPIGEARIVQVRSTALGFVGVIIMIVAGSVLGLALLWRIIRRVRSGQPPGSPPPEPVRVATPEPVS
jgi:hypothetical protein